MSNWSNDLDIEVIKDYLKECAENDDYHYEHYQIDVLLHEFERLNNKINRIEEDKKIEKIKEKYCSQISKVELAQKINEIIDYINEEK